MHRMPWSRSCARKKCNKRELCLARLSFLYLFCAFLCPREIGVLSVSSLERMAGTTRLELATSAVTESLDIKRCRRTSFDTLRYRTSLLIVPLLYPDLAGLLNFSDHILE